MELENINQSLEEYRLLFSELISQRREEEDVSKEISFLIENILGFVEQKEVIQLKCGLSKLVPACEEECDREIKFLIEAKDPDHELTDEDVEDGIECVLKNSTSMLVITNGKQLKLYAVADIDGEVMNQLVFDFDLMNDSISHLSQNLWTLCRKDCGRKIIVHLH